MRTRALYIAASQALACVVGLASPARAADWPYWRGPEQDGNAREKAVVLKWSPEGENLLWKSDIGGRTTPIIMNGRVFFNCPVGDGECLQERVVCLDADTGKLIWEHRFNVFFTDIVADRVGWSALCGDPETGNVYCHGTGGEMLCYDRDGKLLWSHSLMEEYNRVSGYGGRLMTPVVDEDRVIISFLNVNWGNHAKPSHRYMAFDKRSGQVVWWAEPGGPPTDTTYAMPYVTVIDGRRMLIAPAGDGKVYALESRTGRTIWSYALSRVGLNITPVADGKYVILGHSEENLDTTTMGRLVCVDASKKGELSKSAEVWRLDGIDAGYCSPSLANGRVYLVDNGATLHAIDAKSGKIIWIFKLGRVGKGSPVVTSDGAIYVGEQNGVFWILKDAGDHCEQLSRQAFAGPNKTIDEIFGSPAVCGGRVYFMTRYGSYCLAANGQNAESEPIPPMAAERPASSAPAAQLLLVPADITVTPGQTVHFQPRLFNDSGAAVDGPTPKIEWSVAGLRGTVSPDGVLTAPVDKAFAAGMVTAKAGKLAASARVRVCPPLPIKEDFEKLKLDAMPPGWIGVVGKTKIVERDGSHVLWKLAEKGKPSPVWRMRAFSNLPVGGGCTVQADLLGTLARKRFKPDMGVINSRYELILCGQTKELELSRWRDEPVYSLRRKIPFEMMPNMWYRMKLRVELNEQKPNEADVRAKVWRRDEAEPEKWTMELHDPCANIEGSPGLFVYSNGTTDKSDGPDVFVDNYQVNPNG